jgi:small subunit ribosomal protein S7
MSRKARKTSRREVQADPRFGSLLAARFVSCIMYEGKRSLAERIFYSALDKVGAKVADVNPIEAFNKAIENVKPAVEVKSRRVGGSNYQIPVEVAPSRREALSIRWLRNAARARGEKTMIDRLANEIIDAYNNTGGAVKKREDTHRMAEANKAFAHYRW